MTNIDRLTKYITQYGSKNIIVHTIPRTKNWIICQKIENDKWAITLENPMGNISYNLGILSDKEHLDIWEKLTRIEIEKKSPQISLAKDLREKVYKFTKKYEQTYKKFIKTNKNSNLLHNKKKKNNNR